MADGSDIEPRPKKGRGQRSKTAKSKQRLSEDESQLHSELQAAVEASLMAHKDESTPRGKKRTSEGVEKKSEPHDTIAQDQATERGQAQPKRTRRTKKEIDECDTTGFANSSEETQVTDARPQATKKGRKGKKVPENVPESSLEDIPQDSMQVQDDAVQDVVMTDAENEKFEPRQMTDEPSQHLASPPRQPSASVSPQSSDAENRPPSSKAKSTFQQPSVSSPTKNPGQSVRLPLATATPAASPSKRNVINGRLISAFPWQAADLETVFLGSPDKENVTLTDALRTVSAELTSPEKKMTVEEWIKNNASKGEEKLRRDCERLVSVFETQGVNALKSLEGIECV